VRNIYKYYVAYKLMQDAQAAERQAHEQVTPVTKEAVHARNVISETSTRNATASRSVRA